ncbi:helix-turn-helix domain-containing protein [Saccharopolyspora phatthalungensis]|uniref:Transcriptional regulator with XRE-family HTH domain n=1 Tax=Saccharopolyspora phatthalungensis TaxID=664693 RepID=A0A840QGV1_9PSEU|nr:helix-turn-helix transcriptional regulator [Saccharopolyspora phatthalungensis]MBB5156423.1 transcriptional regulator with XRE-family HTH domain [Saccharopolyspora phatthalungensis]
MTEQPTLFGAELRRLRIAAGLSLTRMAALVHYSKGHLSKIETGSKRPTPDFARRCDAILDAGGKLARMAPAQPSEAPLPEEARDGEVWLMSLGSDGKSWFQPMDRRQALAAGAASVLAFGMGTGHAAAEDGTIPVLRAMFDQFRQLGQTASPSVVLPALIAQTHTLRELAARSRPRLRAEILALNSRYAEFAGWMAQESGNDRAALWWTDRAVELAEAGEDRTLAAYSLVRRALVTLYREDARETIDLAHQAQRTGASTRIRGLAAQREAQGHALAGDYNACMRSLERARDLLGAAQPEAGPVLGTANLPDPVAMVAGWCLHDLGRARDATAILDREIQRVPPHALRSQARYGVRRALAHAAAGEIDHACTLLGQVLGVVDTVSSATIATDLRRLARVLSRYHTASSVRALQPRLVASLHNLTV